MGSKHATPAPENGRPFVPPRWFVRSAWAFQRAGYRLTRGRWPLRRPVPDGKFGMLRLRVVGRRSGQERAVILGYVEDDGRYVTLAMNGWGDPPPAWWLNLRAHPDAVVDTVDGPRPVRGAAAQGEERERLWDLVGRHQGWGEIDRFAAHRAGETPVVVLAPR
ncbi:nitroreductase/quinone reductase family protein [Krasilnikoviella flava]|uniref:Deazaflavin-dependent oxidoreductase, nitroreductase family n=1 Tax=Krasilnikoviella flava TaxID=526729 RepID=A0A1T5LSQ2_9MICO|nr:nitroreductase/quinone reductase family protein [Krasilnikoviella flava]SKC78568.1 deazaflavin-dependent oxidoreductase, nitroreductase family [Krasilnikoviella flava]